jgi:KDO2-lipid IV(A) lauroyltransferase
MKKTSFEDALILNLIKLGRFWVSVLPTGVSLACARAIGAGIYAVAGKRRRVALRNLRMAFAAEKGPRELERIAKRSVQNLAMAVVDMLRIPDMTRQDIERRFTVEGRENFEPALREKKGAIFLTGHFGSWELLNIAGGLLGHPITVLARLQKHPRSDGYLNDLRRSKGGQEIHRGLWLRGILRALKRGDIVGILSDQDGGPSGRFVDFFGRLSSTPPGAAAFSLRTGVPIFPVFITRESTDRHRIEVQAALKFPPADWPAERAETFLLQQFAAALESKVRRTPEQWLWSYRRWKSSPDRRVLILSDGKAGHVNQSAAVCEAIRRERRSHSAFDRRVSSEVVQVRFRGRAFQKAVRALSLALGGRLVLARFWMRMILAPECYRTLLGTYADIVISCGSSLVDVNLWMKKENQARSVVVMKPAFGPARFDAVIAPGHDRLAPHPRVFQTEGALSVLRPEDLELASGALAAELGLTSGARRLGVLIGGDTGTLRFERAAFEDLMRTLREHSLRAGVQVFLTTSRRTPPWAESWLKRAFDDRSLCPFLLVANESNRPGAVAGILGLSDAVVATADSVSMVSEAVSAGKPVLVIRPWRSGRLKPKYEEYLRRLENDGRSFGCDGEDFEPKLERALSGAWPVTQDYRSRQEAVLGEAARRVMS